MCGWSLVSTICIFANPITLLPFTLLQELFKPLLFFLFKFIISYGQLCVVHRNRLIIVWVFAHSSQLFLFLFQTSHVILKFFLHFFVCHRTRFYPSCFLKILFFLFDSFFGGSLTFSQRHLVLEVEFGSQRTIFQLFFNISGKIAALVMQSLDYILYLPLRSVHHLIKQV